MDFNTMMWFLAQEAPAEGFLTMNTIIILVVGLIVGIGVGYWYRGRGATK